MSKYKTCSKLRLKVILDLKTWHFRLQSINEDDDFQKSSTTIKTLSMNELKKLGREILNEPYPILPGHVYKCFFAECARWVNGTCIQHPVIFIKETRPSKIVYTALDTVPEFMYVAQSTIPNAGSGIFTRMALPVGVAFGPYAGFITMSKRAEHRGYAWQKYRLDWSCWWVDAKHELFSNWMRYVNCARWEEEQNVLPYFYYGNTFYITYKVIPANSELLTWYGESYAKHLKISVEYGEGYYDKKMAPKMQKS